MVGKSRAALRISSFSKNTSDALVDESLATPLSTVDAAGRSLTNVATAWKPSARRAASLVTQKTTGCQNGAFDVSFESPRVSGGPTQLVSFPSNDALQRARPPILSRLAFGAAARLVRGFCSGFRGGFGGRFQESHNGLLRSAGRRADEHRVSGPGHDVVLVEVPRGVSGVRGVLKERVHRRFRLSHHIDLGHHGESDASGGHELLDLLRSAWLLSAELVAGEQQELQAGVVVGVVKSH
eukprot:scaffold2324_cov266-Pinguiococcus_pyrenoidosus.AAC.10